MTRLALPVDPRYTGFLVQVEVDNIQGVKDQLKKAGRPIPPPYPTTALIDTGASICAATGTIIRALELPTKSAQKRAIMTAGGGIESRDHFAGLRLSDARDIQVEYATVCEFDFSGAPFQFIIGMNALTRWNWSYNRADQKLVIETG